MAKISFKDQYQLIMEDNSTITEKIEYLQYYLTTLPANALKEREEIQQIINDLQNKSSSD